MFDIWQIINLFCFERGNWGGCIGDVYFLKMKLREWTVIMTSVLHWPYMCLQGSIKCSHMSCFAFCSPNWTVPPFAVFPHKAAGPFFRKLQSCLSLYLFLLHLKIPKPHTVLNIGVHQFHKAAKLCPLFCFLAINSIFLAFWLWQWFQVWFHTTKYFK